MSTFWQPTKTYTYSDYLQHSIDNIEHLVSDPHKYGLPKVKKFPLPDRRHVISAIRFFNYATPSQEEELARAIIKRAKEYGVDLSKINIGDNNRFKKYMKGKTIE